MEYQEYRYSTQADDGTWVTSAANPGDPLPATPNAQLMPLTPNPVLQVNPQSQTPSPEALMLGSFLQTQTQQMYLLRDLDMRLARLEVRPATSEAKNVRAAAAASFERATWWALWGILMLVLGGALAIVMLLILLNLQFR